MTDKEQYRAICADESSIPLYSRDWWLDCVCGSRHWDVLLYRNKEAVEAAMPFYSPLKKTILMPAFTQTMGIWFNPEFENPNYSKNLLRKQLICNYFIKYLPAHSFFLQHFHSSFTDWLPFYWNGYRQTTRYNYILPDIKNTDALYSRLGGDIKRNIAKAQKKYGVEIRREVSPDLFMEHYSMVFNRQGLQVYQPKVLKKIIETCLNRKQGDIWGAFDEHNRLHAAVFVVWQNDCAYYIASGSNPELRKSGAHACALWKAIVDVSKHVQAFELSGTMLSGVEHFFREFGTVQLPYHVISKGKWGLRKRILLKMALMKKG
jgi:hypothetical protein